MYIAREPNGTLENFSSIAQLVNHYNQTYKGDHEIGVFEGMEDSTGEVLVGEFIFSFTTENFGYIS